MSTASVPGGEPALPPGRPNLESLVRGIDRDPVRSKRLIRQYADDDGTGFLRDALQLLRLEADTAAAQHLLAIIVSNGLLLQALCDPGSTREQALAMAQAAARVDPMVDVTLARILADSIAEDNTAEFEQHARLMDILGTISDGSRIFPSLVRLMRHPNAHLRSKAVLLIGRGNRSPKWLRKRLTDADPRIRANAAEALWGVDSEEARELLQSLVHDSNNRVAGNAILGLYKLGDPAVIPEIVAMARHESAMFRATAAWVMGEARDPRFTENVAELLREPNVIVRKRAFSALAAIRAVVGQSSRDTWRLTARLLEPEPGRTSRRIMLGFAGLNGARCPALLPTHFVASEDAEPVLRYRVVDRSLAGMISVVFVLPRNGGAAVTAWLPWKRPSDLWAPLYYARETPAVPAADHSLRYLSNPEAIALDLERVPPVAACLDVWRTVACAVNPEAGGVGGKRNVIVFTDHTDRPSPGELLRATIVSGQAFLQVISTGPDPIVEDFCRRVGGIFRVASPDAATDAYLTLLGRYELSYHPMNPEARALKLRVYGPGLNAETSVALTSNPSPAGS